MTSMDFLGGFALTRLDIFRLARTKWTEAAPAHYKILEQEIAAKFCVNYSLTEQEKQIVRKMLSELKSRWAKNNKKEDRFLKYNGDWLNASYLFGVSQHELGCGSKGTAGRPQSDFSAVSDWSKRKRTERLRSESSPEELSYAAQMSLRADGKLDAAAVLKDITTTTPTRARRYRDCFSHVRENSLTADNALAVMVMLKQSKSEYQDMRNVSLLNKCKLYPSYKKVAEAKQACYPCVRSMTITDFSVELSLQSLLDHTAQRILLQQTEVIAASSSNVISDLQLICKWGCDGSSGQSNYKQSLYSEDGEEIDDSSIFFTSVVPLQLATNGNHRTIVWHNNRPGSPRFCRPLKIEFKKETKEHTQLQVENVRFQEMHLTPLETVVNGKKIKVTYKLQLTMIDGKVCNAITNTASTQRCYLCNATSSEFNDVDAMIDRPTNPDNFQYGLSTLHAWIRLFECCLHIAYRLEVKTWQIRDVKLRERVEERKRTIQEAFKTQLSLIIDRPKQVYGSSNDGNTARRFFANSAISASITGLNLELIQRFHIVLQVLSSDHRIDVYIFEEYALETARLFVGLYPWYNMPSTVHKILLHGKDVIRNSVVPIGYMSEEAQEACNKFLKRFREDFTRKCSRKNTMEDLFARMMINSDPVISSLTVKRPNRPKTLSPEALQMLLAPEHTNSTSSSESEDASSDEARSDVDENI